ncbi:MAG: hypothetical protein FWC41_05720 [Firmicutes bacterium]|nr:hypothetical protein [Bacillota bacterium]
MRKSTLKKIAVTTLCTIFLATINFLSDFASNIGFNQISKILPNVTVCATKTIWECGNKSCRYWSRSVISTCPKCKNKMYPVMVREDW